MSTDLIMLQMELFMTPAELFYAVVSLLKPWTEPTTTIRTAQAGFGFLFLFAQDALRYTMDQVAWMLTGQNYGPLKSLNPEVW